MLQEARADIFVKVLYAGKVCTILPDPNTRSYDEAALGSENTT